MMIKTFLMAATFAGAAGAVVAQSVTAAYPETVTRALEDLGYSAEIGIDSVGDPQVTSSINGLNYVILFYGCTDNTSCEDIQFRATFQTEGSVSRDILHDWNRDYFVGKAYLSDSGSAVIEHAVVSVDGMSRSTFERVLWRWDRALTSFTEQIEW
ncbi:MAG: YbjN domain-containing protein [Proteobacteria bacterium]|nr:YbjN domain-containing protein [Pseudomonadota bacterium]